MAETSAIEWTDATFNPWIGCTKVSPACDNCYAAVATPSRTLAVEWGAGKPRHRTSAANWALPIRWNAQLFYACSACEWRGQATECKCVPHPDDQMPCAGCPRCGSTVLAKARRRVFCASLADWLDSEVPAEWLADLLSLIATTPNLDWLLLTKRIGNWCARIQQSVACFEHRIASGRGNNAGYAMANNWLLSEAPPNILLGATICNQTEADRDVPKLLRVPTAVCFLSIEPMLGPIDVYGGDPDPRLGGVVAGLGLSLEPYWEAGDPPGSPPRPHVDWIIAGGESGSNARPSHPDWFRSLRDQCAAADVPFLFKQWGEWRPPIEGEDYNTANGRSQRVPAFIVAPSGTVHCFENGEWTRCGEVMLRVGKKAAGRTLDGKTHNEFPEVCHG